MSNLSFYYLLTLFFCVPINVFAQYEYEIEAFEPLPKNVEKITATQYIINEKDTTSEIFFEFRFDKRGNTTSWEYFPYHIKEKRKYDSLNRIIEIDGLYGESFGNGIIEYQYPSKNQKIEIHDKMGFYKYIKSDFIFDSASKIIKEIKYDSTFDKMETHSSSKKVLLIYAFDEYGNKIEELCFSNSTEKLELIYEMKTGYTKNKLSKQTKTFTKEGLITGSSDKEIETVFYVAEGEFKDKILREEEFSMIKTHDEFKKIIYSYQRLDSLTISKEKRYFTDRQLIKAVKYFYQGNQLIRAEEYVIENNEPKLVVWTDYTYYFYSEIEE